MLRNFFLGEVICLDLCLGTFSIDRLAGVEQFFRVN